MRRMRPREIDDGCPTQRGLAVIGGDCSDVAEFGEQEIVESVWHVGKADVDQRATMTLQQVRKGTTVALRR